MWGSDWGHGAWGVLWMVLFWAVVIGLVYLLARAVTPGRSGERPRDARDILDERFARGEISEEEYRERKRVLDESTR